MGDFDQRPALAKARRKLFEAREQRVRPGRFLWSGWEGDSWAAAGGILSAWLPPGLIYDRICAARTPDALECRTFGQLDPSNVSFGTKVVMVS